MKVTVLYLSFYVFHSASSMNTKDKVFLRLSPSRRQFFQYESLSLRCEGSDAGGLLKRNTSTRGPEACSYGWGNLNGSVCTIYTIYPIDKGAYWCETSSGQRSRTVHITVTAVLRVLPNKAQFFQYESVSLSCGQQRNWSVKRNTSKNISEDCSSDEISEPDCYIDALYPSDSGVYWCESAAGECSEIINITVTGGLVILESPVHPVVEGDNVTLGCRQKTTSSSNFTAQFYRDGLLIGSSSTGTLTISSVSRDDQGLYMCSVSGGGPSPDAWLIVRAVSDIVDPEAPDPRSAPGMSIFRLICHVVVGTPYLVVTIILGLIYRDKRRRRRRRIKRRRAQRFVRDRCNSVAQELV
ncbi:uncharacterized protein V6R79_022733 [Siganus canaliculatus]